jgi:hypothetical protein
MKRFINFTLILIAIITMASCGGNKHQDNKFVGSFTDEFENKFTLNEDYSATIQFVGEDSVIKTTWSDGDNHDRAYATIKFNGDPTYYFLRDGKLYRHLEEMQQGRCAINIKYDD